MQNLMAFHLGEDCRPEFLKQIRSEFAGETQRGSRQSALDGTLAVDTPGIREKVVSDVAGISRISGMELPIAAARSKGQIRRVRDASPEVSVGGLKISRILFPSPTHARFDCIASRDSRKTHTIALCKAIPVRSIFLRIIECGSPPGAYDTACKALRADCRNHNPLEPFLPRNFCIAGRRNGACRSCSLGKGRSVEMEKEPEG